jgi:tetratricopeptide (TPR) repeat protein
MTVTRSALNGAPAGLWAIAVVLLVGPAVAQENQSQGQGQGQGQRQGQQQTKVVPTMRLSISDDFTEANTCLEEGDIECAQEILDDVSRIRDLNNYERGQLYNFQAFMAYELDDVDAAISAYESIMELPQEDLPDGLISSSMRNLATLYLQVERLQEGLDLYQQWMDLPYITPNSNDYYLLASIHYQMEQYADGIPPIQQAIKLANDRGELGEENWYVLLYVFYYQLEQTDNVIDTLTILVENWTKRSHVLALAGQLSEQGRDDDTLTLFESAYEAGWLNLGTEWVQLANLYLNAGTPYKAAVLLDKGLEDDIIESTDSNWRLLAQAWQLSAEHEKALPALRQASDLAEDGRVDQLLAQSLARLALWDECAVAAQKALDRGGLTEEGYVQMQLGQCLVNQRKYDEARVAFQAARSDDRRAEDAGRWLNFINEEVKRERANAEALAAVARN